MTSSLILPKIAAWMQLITTCVTDNPQWRNPELRMIGTAEEYRQSAEDRCT